VFDERIVIRGGGDLGSGTAIRLQRAGFPVVILESSEPLAVRRTVSFAEAVSQGHQTVEGVCAELVDRPAEVEKLLSRGIIPLLVDPCAATLGALTPYSVVDAIMAKCNKGTHIGMAPFVLALGPGFSAPEDVHAVIETNRGPDLGRVIWIGRAEPNSGEPGSVLGIKSERVLRSPRDGVLKVRREIGEIVQPGVILATVDEVPIRAPFAAVLRGLARDGLQVRMGAKVGDLDPRLDPTLCSRASDKAMAIAGGVLEAVLVSMRGNRR
jgi:xanthine dehydrogenase accessory factor